ncbi:LolA family protein [Wenxinia marina]|uniref:Outer membrane lipoprotein-sorting protein n=1 Tax=Wenxinia marina DSM 24838 TaxID=1123501 RepID=A0A0D0Q9P9_9RHOB|nr:outer membrane lipoprotein carrier protein LolA [Wenxinia marina]KIQ71154.1 Outer membrane lipoprotein-sorting protein [Wenxinia marina DSM 24838]GGL54411.1 outer-membrane lipoprotein carrier protein [Wenxinia marina]
MYRRHLLALLAAAPLAAGLAAPAHAQQLSLNEISAYLNGMQTATGGFTQINADGTISTGTVYIKRPGRVRFEYNPPERALTVAGGGSVAVFDGRSNDNPQRYPLNTTPLSIILAQNVNLGQANMVTGHTSDGTTTTVTAQDPAHPEYGSIQLKFTANPVELRQWVITDDTGTQTTVILNDLRTGVSVGDILFNIQAATRNWNG